MQKLLFTFRLNTLLSLRFGFTQAMIEYDNKVWFRHILKFHKTDTFRILLREMMIVAAYTALVAAIEIHFLRDLRMTESGEAVEKVLKLSLIHI